MLGFFDKYPYTDFHELNLDWLLKAVRELAAEIHDFEIVNQFTYEGNWDITKQYKKFAIVTVNGTEGYIALQAVPAGIAITNTDYWAMIADYTAVIAGLGARITALEGDIVDINNRLGVDYESIVWIGDSYTSAGSLGADVDKRFSTLVSASLGLTEYNYAVGGTGYVYGPTPYTVQASNAVTDFINNDRDRDTVKYVMVIGNRNDADGTYSYNDISSAAASVFNTLHNGFPNATIVVIPCIWDWKLCPLKLLHYSEIVLDVASKRDYIRIVDNAWTWGTGLANCYLWQSGADLHPNVEGHALYANHILGAINGQNYKKFSYYTFAPTTQHANTSNMILGLEIVDGKAILRGKFQASDVISGQLFSYTFNAITLNNLYFMHNDYPIPVEIYTDDGTITTGAKVNIQQVSARTGETTGSMTLTGYCFGNYSGVSTDPSKYNYFKVEIPYGLRYEI